MQGAVFNISVKKLSGLLNGVISDDNLYNPKATIVALSQETNVAFDFENRIAHLILLRRDTKNQERLKILNLEIELNEEQWGQVLQSVGNLLNERAIIS